MNIHESDALRCCNSCQELKKAYNDQVHKSGRSRAVSFLPIRNDNKIVKVQYIQTKPKTELDISVLGLVHLKNQSGQTQIEFRTSDPTCRML